MACALVMPARAANRAKGKAFGINRVASCDKILGRSPAFHRPTLRIIPQRKRPDTIIIVSTGWRRRDNFTPFVLVNQPFKQIADHLNFRQPNGFAFGS